MRNRTLLVSWAGLVMSVVVLVAACVYPSPPDGEPEPALELTLTGPDPETGELLVSAVPVEFEPDEVRFRILKHAGPVTVEEPPFETTFDVSGFPNGTFSVLARGVDDTYTVLGLKSFTVRTGPSFVVIYLDDLDELVTPYWDALPQSQALLRENGLVFTHAFANNPACCPARALTLTGRYPQNTGVEANSPPVGGFEAFVGAAENDTIATRLQDHGYTTAFLGKYLNGYEQQLTHVPPGWDEWFGFGPGFYSGYDYEVNHNGSVTSYGPAPEDYQTDVLAQRSVEFLEGAVAAAADRPFFLFLSPSAPHLPLQPAPRHADHPWVDAELPQRPNFDEEDVSDKPTWLREGIPPIPEALLAWLTLDHRDRMGSLLAVDDMIGEIVATLDTLGVLDDTVVVFTSDNGYHLGAHRLPAKQSPYEESIRIPMVVTGPGVAQGVLDEYVGLVDLAPTLLELAGLPVDDLDGRSFVPLLEGGPQPWTNEVFLSHRGSIFATQYHTLEQVLDRIAAKGASYGVPTYRAVRTETHLYVEWYGGDVHEYELYDLDTDPYQLENLLATPEGEAEHAATVEELHARLDELSACAGPACRD